ncbi:hypothetical protein VTP01DRAFT_5373, partial [Rhizomucor pusillus]|uniref:uncharacterized protein n=1 Tax=Rhizomucor pusillus TaxID=4840 RepID=UPI0037445751
EAKKAINALASKALIHKIKAAVYSFYTDKRVTSTAATKRAEVHHFLQLYEAFGVLALFFPAAWGGLTSLRAGSNTWPAHLAYLRTTELRRLFASVEEDISDIACVQEAKRFLDRISDVYREKYKTRNSRHVLE